LEVIIFLIAHFFLCTCRTKHDFQVFLSVTSSVSTCQIPFLSFDMLFHWVCKQSCGMCTPFILRGMLVIHWSHDGDFVTESRAVIYVILAGVISNLIKCSLNIILGLPDQYDWWQVSPSNTRSFPRRWRKIWLQSHECFRGSNNRLHFNSGR